MNTGNDLGENVWKHYRVVETERVEADREAAYLYFLSRDPEYAARWLTGLTKAIQNLAEFPGPFRYAIDEEAT